MTLDSGHRWQSNSRANPHLLLPREKLDADYRRQWQSPAVAEYGLAVRDLVETEFGAIDTWSKVAQLFHGTTAERTQRRKALSRQFTAESKGPAWPWVELLVQHVLVDRHQLSPEKHEAELARLAGLYEAARGRPPRRTVRPMEARADTRTATGRPEAELIGALNRQVATLHRANAALRAQLAAAKEENSRWRDHRCGATEFPARDVLNTGHFSAPDPETAVRSSARRRTVPSPDTPAARQTRLDTITAGQYDAVLADAGDLLSSFWSHPRPPADAPNSSPLGFPHRSPGRRPAGQGGWYRREPEAIQLPVDPATGAGAGAGQRIRPTMPVS